MQFADVLCFLILMITVTASNLGADEHRNKDLKQSQSERKISKREATILMGPLEPNSIFQKPKVIYRRISQPQRFVPPSTHKYRSSKPRSKAHKSSKLNRKQHKKYRTNKNKHFPSKQAFKSYKPKWFRDSLPKYGPPSLKSKPHPESVLKSKIPRHEYTGPEYMGFGEPPTNFASNYHPKIEGYGEPPIDSFAAPMKLTKNRVILPQGFQESNKHYEKDEDQMHKYSSWEYNRDNNLAYSKTKPSFAKPESEELFATATAQDNEFEDMYRVNASGNKNYKKRFPHFIDNNKVVRSPWHVHKISDLEKDTITSNKKRPALDEDVIVGGQYAEPPGRYVGRFQPSAPMFKEDEDTFLPIRDVVDHAIPSSKSISPYVNYKNSNLAFSPQNLNDAFGIVDT